MYNRAVADQILSEDENPAARVPKPRRLRSARMPLPDSMLSAIGDVAGSTGNDPALDSLIIRLHTETAWRRGGALAFTPEDLDPEQCLIRLHEKAGRAAGSRLTNTDDPPARARRKQRRPGIRRAPAAVPGRHSHYYPAVVRASAMSAAVMVMAIVTRT